MYPKKIIFDTDIGSDIDDAIALYLTVNSPELEIVGITTVYRNTQKRARIAKAILNDMGAEHIPVYCGCDHPILQDPEKIEPDFVKQHYDKNGLYIPPQYDDSMESYKPDAGHAVDFIIDTCKRSSGSIDILAIGALTNLAIAIRKEPLIINDIAGITLMGGYFTNTGTEWNICCDPEAAKIVFESGIPIKAVGLDVTLQCELTDEDLDRFRKWNEGGRKILNRLLSRWFTYYQFRHPVLHDPLAAASMFSDCVTFQKQKICVVTEGNQRGATLPDEEHGTEIWTAASVDRMKFFQMYEERLLH